MATPTKYRTEFLVNATTNADQYGPAITGLPNGRFVATWTDTSGTAPDFSICSRAQIFNADGSRFGAEFVVNTTTNDGQLQPEITALSGGGFAVTFLDLSQLNTGPDFSNIRVQVFDVVGTKIGGDFVAPATSVGNQTEPVIAKLHLGRYVVAWTDSSATGGDTSGDAIRSQVFNADGTRFGAEVLVNTTTAGSQQDAAVTALANGNYVVGWSSRSANIDGIAYNTVYSQVFRPNGSKLGGEYVASTIAGLMIGQDSPDITGLAGGRYVLTWNDTSHYQTDILGQMFNPNGTPHGAVFMANATTAFDQTDSTTTALPDGGFVVAWVDSGLPLAGRFNPEIRAQVFHASGARSGAEILVNTDTTGLQRAPSVAALADGRFVVTWEDLGGGPGDSTFAIRAQIFDGRSAAINLTGTAGADTYVGTKFNDRVAGLAGRDVLAGGAGDDILRGGTGRDLLTGGAGLDTFVFATAAEAGLGTARDRITDFKHGADHLDFSAFMAGGHFIGSAPIAAGDGPQVRFNAGTGVLQGDVTGDGTVDFALTLDGGPALTDVDFVF